MNTNQKKMVISEKMEGIKILYLIKINTSYQAIFRNHNYRWYEDTEADISLIDDADKEEKKSEKTMSELKGYSTSPAA